MPELSVDQDNPDIGILRAQLRGPSDQNVATATYSLFLKPNALPPSETRVSELRSASRGFHVRIRIHPDNRGEVWVANSSPIINVTFQCPDGVDTTSIHSLEVSWVNWTLIALKFDDQFVDWL